MTVSFKEYEKLNGDKALQKAFKAEITKVRNGFISIKEQQEIIHGVAMIAAYIVVHKDNNLTQLNELLNEFEKANLRTQTKQFKRWAKDFLGLRIAPNKKDNVPNKFQFDKQNPVVIDLEKCNANPYYDIKMISEAEVKEFTLERALKRAEKIVSDIEQALADNNVSKGDTENLVKLSDYLKTDTQRFKAVTNKG